MLPSLDSAERTRKVNSISHRIIVSSVLEKDGRFLFVKQEEQGQSRLDFPAGPLRVGESPVQCAMREMLESTGYLFIPTHLVGLYDYFHSRSNVIFLYMAYTGTIFDLGVPPEVSGTLRWLDYGELQPLRGIHGNPFILRCVEDHLKGKAFPLDLVNHFPADPTH